MTFMTNLKKLEADIISKNEVVSDELKKAIQIIEDTINTLRRNYKEV